MKNLPVSMRFFRNFPLGVFVGTVVALLFVWALDANLTDAVERNVSSLFGAIVGLLAASLALAGVLTNISNQNNLADKQRRAKLVAAKAVLPLVLSQMSQIARRGAEISIAQNVQQETPESISAALTLSKETLTSLQSAIEHADRRDGIRLANLIRSYQVSLSRTQSHVLENGFRVTNRLEHAIDWAILYQLIADCFEYSREEATHIPSHLERNAIGAFFSVQLRASRAVILELNPLILEREQRPNFEMFAQTPNAPDLDQF